MLRLTMLFILSCSFLCADCALINSAPHLQDISPNGTLIRFMDGSVWRADYEISKNDPLWQKGDPLSLCIEQCECECDMPCFLKNLRSKDSIRIQKEWVEPPQPLFVHEIQEIHPKGYYLRLNDGNTWEIDWAFSWHSCHWKKGDNIYLFPSANLKECYLINFNQTRCSPQVYGRLLHKGEKELYRYFVKDIAADFSKVKLQNGFIWKVCSGLFKNFNESLRQWQVGDEVVVEVHDSDKDMRINIFRLINLRTLSYVEVFFVKQGEEFKSLQIEEVASKGVKLNDGSFWEMGFRSSFATSYWKKGDRILLFRNSEGNHLLINPETFYSAQVVFDEICMEQQP